MQMFQYNATHKKTSLRGIVYGLGYNDVEGMEKIVTEYCDVFFTGVSSKLGEGWE